MPKAASKSAEHAPRPDVIVDFVCEHGMLCVSLKNIGLRSAYRVSTVFDKPLHGLSGQKCISEMQLFRCVEFVPPGKEFSQLVDPVANWFQQGRPSRFTITITYSDREGNSFRERIVHNLEIYKDLGSISIPGGKDGRRAS